MGSMRSVRMSRVSMTSCCADTAAGGFALTHCYLGP